MEMFLIVLAAFAIVMLAMAVGVILSNRPLRGSCGGPALLDSAGEPMTCPDCNCKIEIDVEDRAHPSEAA